MIQYLGACCQQVQSLKCCGTLLTGGEWRVSNVCISTCTCWTYGSCSLRCLVWNISFSVYLCFPGYHPCACLLWCLKMFNRGWQFQQKKQNTTENTWIPVWKFNRKKSFIKNVQTLHEVQSEGVGFPPQVFRKVHFIPRILGEEISLLQMVVYFSKG